MSTPIAFDAISKRYAKSERAAVDAITLSVNEGDILALLGQSGSGKTTLLRLAAGLERPDSGSVAINGKCVASPSCWTPPEHRKIGIISQEGALFPHLSVAANIAYGLTGTERRKRQETVAQMLALVGLEAYAKRYPHELSGGERQRVALARALAPRPEVLLLDEPFSNLDTALRHSLRNEVRHILTTLNTTAILVVHDPEDALSAADRIAILRLGRLEQLGSASDAYFNPANEYCARLFGPVNRLDTKGGQRWLRPEQCSILAQGSIGDTPPATATSATIASIHNAGRCLEVRVHLEHNGAEWLLYEPLDKRWQRGDRVAVFEKKHTV